MKTPNQKRNPKNNSNPSLEEEVELLKEEIYSLKKRNEEKDVDKAWETSKERKALISLFTYFVFVILMASIGVDDPFINAIIPTLGFLISTLSLSLLRIFWK